MKNSNYPVDFLKIFKSSLWITVFIVRVGCIIEVQAHPVNTNSDLDIGNLHGSDSFENTRIVLLQPGLANKSSTPSTSLQVTSKKLPKYHQSSSFKSSRSLSLEDGNNLTQQSGSLQQSAHEHADDDDDSCHGKKDGYYSNLSSGCASYYFCAAGYQISYVCPPNTYFNGDKCLNGDYFKCPHQPDPNSNPCINLSNGYYPMKRNPQKYFYCYHKSKVIELSCGEGKYYNRNEKGCMSVVTSSSTSSLTSEANLIVANNESCENKSNGFYTESSSNCTKYYYCIQGEKTTLECQPNYVFDGSLCVLKSRFDCPQTINNNNVRKS